MGVIRNFISTKNKGNYLLFLMQRYVKDNKNRLKIAKFISKFSPDIDFENANSCYGFLKNLNVKDIAEKLKTEGIFIYPDIFFSDKEIKSILKKLEGQELHDPYSEKKGFNSENIPDEVNCAHYKREFLSTVSEIINLANDPGILAIAREYLNATPTLSNINLWWGTYSEHPPRDNELFHRDKDDYNFIKFFIYLTDVDENDYNIVYVKNSLNSNKALDKLRYSLDEVKSLFGENNIIHATGKRGTGFMGANYGVHNGTLPKYKDRKTLLLQIEYSIRGIQIENYQPVKISDIDGALNTKLNPWVNRLIFRN